MTKSTVRTDTVDVKERVVFESETCVCARRLQALGDDTEGRVGVEAKTQR